MLPSSSRWVGPGCGHLGAPPTSQQRLLLYSHNLDSVLLGRGPGEMDTVVSGVPSALCSLRFFAHFRKAGSNWAGCRDISSIVA